MQPHSTDLQELIRSLDTDAEKGLTANKRHRHCSSMARTNCAKRKRKRICSGFSTSLKTP